MATRTATKKKVADPSFIQLLAQARGKMSVSDFGQKVGIHGCRIRELELGEGEEPTPAEKRAIEKVTRAGSVLT
jgi:hypothetical protein